MRHYARTTVLPDHIYVASKSGKAYHIFQGCQYVDKNAQVNRYQVCSVCQQKHKARR